MAPRIRSRSCLTRGRDEVQRYIIDEVQKVYKLQGVNTNDKHIEVICRQMLRKVSIVYPGDTDFLQDERIDRFEFNRINEEILAAGRRAGDGDAGARSESPRRRLRPIRSSRRPRSKRRRAC